MNLFKNKCNIVMAIGINTLFLALALLFCDIKYEVSDDFVMATILSGAYGESPDPQMIFVNTLLGYFLLPFYYIFPSISWYLVFQLVLCLVSFILVTYMLLERLNRYIAVLIILLLLTMFSDDVYILPQFTKTAMLAVMAGGLVFLWTILYKKSKLLLILSSLVCVAGTLIRFSTIYIAGGFIIFILLLEYYALIKKKKYKSLILTTILGGVLIGSVVAFHLVNIYTYQNDSASDYFRRYNTARGKIVDQIDYGYEAYESELKKIGISETDYYILKGWSFGDDEYFDLEKMEKIAAIITEYNSSQKIDWGDLYEQIQERKILNYPVFWACAIILAMSIICQKKSYRYILVFGIGLLFEVYFFVAGRVVYRVEYGIFLSVFLASVFLWKNENSRLDFNNYDTQKVISILSVIIFLVQIPIYIPDNSYKSIDKENRKEYIDSIFGNSWDYNALKYRKVVNYEKQLNGLIEEIEEHPENFYFLDFGTTIQSLYFEWSPFQNLPIGYYNNNLYLAGITSNLPSVNYILENRGIKSPLKDLVKDNIYLVDNYNLQLKLDYIREHYYPNVKADLYKEVGGYQIWKFYLE